MIQVISIEEPTWHRDVKIPGLSAKGAKYIRRSKIVVIIEGPAIFRAFSAKKNFDWFHLGRWPRLSHFAPLALRPGIFT
jgi:hypothetical protein